MDQLKLQLPSPFFRCFERTSLKPQIYRTQLEMTFLGSEKDHFSIRSIAPYVLQVKDEQENVFLPYVAVIGKKEFTKENHEMISLLQKLPNSLQRQMSRYFQITDKWICMAFENHDGYLASLGGYFLAESSKLFLPNGKRPSHVQITNMNEIKSQLGLIGMPNQHFLMINEYFISQKEDLAAIFFSASRSLIKHVEKGSAISKLAPQLPLSVDLSGEDADNINNNSEHLVQVEDHASIDEIKVLKTVSTFSMTPILQLKNRTRVVFEECDLGKWNYRRVEKYLLDQGKAYEQFHLNLVPETSCHDLNFCPTKFYAGVSSLVNGRNEIGYFTRVFLIGKSDSNVIVLPYKNTNDRETFKLLAPIATDIIYQRFRGEEIQSDEIPMSLDVTDVSVDQVHIPTFVPLPDTVTILRYWKIFSSDTFRKSLPFQSQLVSGVKLSEAAKPPPPMQPLSSFTLTYNPSVAIAPSISSVPSSVSTIEKYDNNEESKSRKAERTEKKERFRLRKKIGRYFSQYFQKSLYQFPSDWSNSYQVNQLFCENVQRNFVHLALRIAEGCTEVEVAPDFDITNIPYGCGPQFFIQHYSKYFGISENDTFICHFLAPVADDEPHSRKFCKQINFKNLFRHLVSKHMWPVHQEGNKRKNIIPIRFLPFEWLPGVIAPKKEIDGPVGDQLAQINTNLAIQKEKGTTYFNVLKESKAKRKLIEIGGSSTPKKIKLNEVGEAVAVKHSPIRKLRKRSYSPQCKRSLESSDSDGTEGLKHASPNNPNKISPKYFMLIQEFIPMNQITEKLRSYMTNWVGAYVGNTEHVAECPVANSAESKFIPNVVVLGTHEKHFIVLPFKVDFLSGNMKRGLPFATEKIFSRKNRPMPQVRVEEVDVKHRLSEKISAEDSGFIKKLRELLELGTAAEKEAVYKRCQILDQK